MRRARGSCYQPRPQSLLTPYLHIPSRPLLGAGTLDDVRKVTDGNGEWEVEGCKHDGEEDPPAG